MNLNKPQQTLPGLSATPLSGKSSLSNQGPGFIQWPVLILALLTVGFLALTSGLRLALLLLIGVALGQLSTNQHQMQLFGREAGEKWESALKSVDAVRQKHGFGKMGMARALSVAELRGREDVIGK